MKGYIRNNIKRIITRAKRRKLIKTSRRIKGEEKSVFYNDIEEVTEEVKNR